MFATQSSTCFLTDSYKEDQRGFFYPEGLKFSYLKILESDIDNAPWRSCARRVTNVTIRGPPSLLLFSPMDRHPPTRNDGLGLLFSDAGLNSSAAWNEHNLEVASINSDNVPLNAPTIDMDWSPSMGRPARAIRDFSGDPNSSEL